MAFEVRELGPRDLDALLEVYRELHTEDAPLPTRPVMIALWQRICSDPALVYMGAFEDGVLLSTCTAAIVLNLTRGARPYAVIENVVTREKARRRGCATATLQALIERCRAADCYKVMLLSNAARDEAHAFYLRAGFDGDEKRGFILKM